MLLKTKTKITKKGNSQQSLLYHYNDPAIEQSEFYARNFSNDDEIYNDWDLDDYRLLTNWDNTEHEGWKFPGTQEPHYWCGQWSYKGCLHSEDHQGQDGKAYVRQFQRSCFRPSCKTCWEKWIGRQSNVATRKIKRYSKKSKTSPIHIVLSVPHCDYGLDYKQMKKKARKILREIKIRGGSMVYHHYRFNKRLRCWYPSPHFHVVCFGFLPKGALGEAYRQNGWYVKYLGVRKSVFATFYYILSHCGIRHRTRSMVWFGDLSYSKLEKEKLPDNNKCPLCRRKLVEIYYSRGDPPVPPDSFFEGFLDLEGWCLVEDSKQPDSYSYDHAPTRESNENLQSLERLQ